MPRSTSTGFILRFILTQSPSSHRARPSIPSVCASLSTKGRLRTRSLSTEIAACLTGVLLVLSSAASERARRRTGCSEHTDQAFAALDLDGGALRPASRNTDATAETRGLVHRRQTRRLPSPFDALVWGGSHEVSSHGRGDGARHLCRPSYSCDLHSSHPANVTRGEVYRGANSLFKIDLSCACDGALARRAKSAPWRTFCLPSATAGQANISSACPVRSENYRRRSVSRQT